MRTRKGQPPVQGVINSGGILADAVIASQTAQGVRCGITPCRPNLCTNSRECNTPTDYQRVWWRCLSIIVVV